MELLSNLNFAGYNILKSTYIKLKLEPWKSKDSLRHYRSATVFAAASEICQITLQFAISWPYKIRYIHLASTLNADAW